MDKIVVNIQNLSVFQHNGNQILTKVQLQVKKGEFVYLIGKTGTGKTSLMRTLYADLPVKEGKLRIGDFDLAQMTYQEIPLLRRTLGIVFQDFQLLNDRSVKDNLWFVLEATGWNDKFKMQKRCEAVLQSVDMLDRINDMPHELSGGEQQRIVLARALLNEPVLIIADEPTGNLDPDTSDDIMKLIRDLSQESGTAVIMATHDYRLINKYPGTVYRTMDGTLLPENVF